MGGVSSPGVATVLPLMEMDWPEHERLEFARLVLKYADSTNNLRNRERAWRYADLTRLKGGSVNLRRRKVIFASSTSNTRAAHLGMIESIRGLQGVVSS
jgi:hypothetical protein